MTALPGTFIPETIPEDDRNFEPIPAGFYKMQVIESRLEGTKAGTGQMLVLTEEVIDGPYANRKIWDRLNIINQNADAERISNRALADLCLQIGVSPLTDSEQLHFKPFMARVTIEADKSGQYGPQNRVRYNVNAKGKGGQAAVQGKPAAGQSQGRPQQARPAAQQAQGGERPWNRPQQAAAPQQELNDDPPF